MRVITRHRPSDPDAFAADSRAALQVLARQRGFVSGELGRSPDDPSLWIITSRWQDVGSMRRGLGAYDAKVALAPVLVSAEDAPSTFEVLVDTADGTLSVHDSDRGPVA